MMAVLDAEAQVLTSCEICASVHAHGTPCPQDASNRFDEISVSRALPVAHAKIYVLLPSVRSCFQPGRLPVKHSELERGLHLFNIIGPHFHPWHDHGPCARFPRKTASAKFSRACAWFSRPAAASADEAHEAEKSRQSAAWDLSGLVLSGTSSQEGCARHVMAELDKGVPIVAVVGAWGCGKSSVLAIVAGRMQGAVVAMRKAPRHTEGQVWRYLAKELSPGAQSLADAMAERGDCLVIVDGVSSAEALMIASAVRTARGRGAKGARAVVAQDDGRAAWDGLTADCDVESGGTVRVAGLSHEERMVILEAEQSRLSLGLSRDELEELSSKTGAASPLYCVYAPRLLQLTSRPGNVRASWTQTFGLPGERGRAFLASFL